MENLIFSLNATVPVFLMMILGLLFKKIGWIDDAFAAKMNKLVFVILLPVLLFEDLATVDIAKIWDFGFVAFCFVATLISIAISAFLSRFLKEQSLRGEFIQASYRSSAALLGTALAENIYGHAGMIPLMIVGSVPLYNMMAVVVLTFSRPEHYAGQKAGLDSAQNSGRNLWKKTIKDILTNPIIIGIALGFLWSLLRLPIPAILAKSISSLSSLATPMGLMAMGAAFDFQKAKGQAKPAVCATLIKLMGFCALFLPLAVWMGFHGEELAAILIMLGSSTTVASFTMAKNMGHEGVLTSSVVMLTTMFSAFSITGWLFLLKTFGLL